MGHKYSVRAGKSLTSPKPIVKAGTAPSSGYVERHYADPNAAPPENGEDEVGWLAEFLDQISRPAYAVRSGIQSLYDEDDTGNIFSAMEKGWNRENRVYGAEEIEKAAAAGKGHPDYDKMSWAEKAAIDFVGSDFFKATAGMVYDVGTDPLSYVPGKVLTAPVMAVARPIHRYGMGEKAILKGRKNLTEEQAAAQGLETERVLVGEEVGPKAQPPATPAGTVMGNDIGGAVFPEPQLNPGKTPKPGPPRSESGAIIVEPSVGGPHAPTFDPTARGAGATTVSESGRPVFAPEYKAPGPTDFLPKAGEGTPFPEMLDPRLKRAKLANPVKPKPASPATDLNTAMAARHDVEAAAKVADDIDQAVNPIIDESDIAANQAVNEAGDVRVTDGNAQPNIGIPDGPYPTERWNTVVNSNKMSERGAVYVKTAREYADRNAALFSENATRETARHTQLGKTLANDKHGMLQSGTAPVVTYKALGEKTASKYFLHLSDMWNVVGDTMYRSFYKAKTQTAPSSWLGAGAAAIHHSNLGKTGPELVELVKAAFIKQHRLKGSKASSSMAGQAAKAIVKHLDKLKQIHLQNETFIAKADHNAGKVVGESAAAKVASVLNDPGSSMSKELVAVADLHGDIARQIRDGGGLPGEASEATRIAGNALQDVVDDLDVAAARTTLRAAKAAQRGDEVAVRRILLEQYRRDANALKEIETTNAGDFASNTARSVEPGSKFAPPADIIANIADTEIDNYLNFFQRMYRGTAIKLMAGAGQGKLFGIRRQNTQFYGKLHSGYNKSLQRIEYDYGREAVDNMFSNIRNGKTRESMSDADKQIFDALYPSMKGVFDPAGGFLDSAVLRSGQTIKGFNSMMKRRGLPQHELTEAYPGEPLAQAYQRQVKNWKIEDPLDFLSKMNQVSADAATLSAMARAAESKGSQTYRDGYVKIARSKDFDEAPITHFIDNEMYIPGEIAEQLRMANTEMLKTVHWGKSNSAPARFMNEVFDPMTRAWKTFATSARPGHHLANASGDSIVNFVHGVNGMDYVRSNRALRSVGMVDPIPYEIMEQIALRKPIDDLARAGKKASPEKRQKIAAMASEHSFTMTLKGGKKVSYTNGQFGDELFRNGALSEFRQLEDIEVAAKFGESGRFDRPSNGPIDRILNRFMNTKYGRVMEKSGEWNANTQRAAQISKHLRDPKFTKKFDTEEDAWFAAVESAYKSHPDAGGLTAFEKKWGRRAMPFYSYTRQILPWAFVNFLAHPGRMLAIPKAQYNLQQLMGQEPQQIGAPFSNAEALPSWAKAMMAGNVMGPDKNPMGTNFGFSLSSPLDTVAEFTNDPEKGLAGSAGTAAVKMINPLITGIPRMMDESKDPSEELDKTLPGLSTVASITGRSPSGTVGNIVSGIPELDPTRSYESGKRTQFLNEALINFFLGLRISDYSDYAGIGAAGSSGGKGL